MPIGLHLAVQNSKILTPPKQDIPSSEKTPLWYKENAMYILSSYYRGVTGPISYNDREKTLTIRRYCEGNQNNEIYKKWLYGDKAARPGVASDTDTETTSSSIGAREGWMSVDFENILNPLPKYIDNLIGKFELQESEVHVDALDSMSNRTKQVKKYKVLAKKQFGFTDGQQDSMPDNKEDLDLFEEMGGLKEEYETGMELLLAHTAEISDIKEISRKIMLDFIRHKCAVAMNKVDIPLQKEKFENLDVIDVILEYSEPNGFKNTRFAGIPLQYSINELRTLTPLSEDQLRIVAESYSGMYGNPGSWNNDTPDETGRYQYDGFLVDVLYSLWRSIDRKNETVVEINNKVLESELKRGKIFEKDNKYYKYITRDESAIQTLHTCMWIVNSDHVFANGRMYDTPYNYTTREPEFPIHAYKIPGKSIGEIAKPICDDIEMTYLKLQNARAKAKPAGIAIEIGALTNLSFNNKKWTPLDIIKLYTHSGHLFYQATLHKGTMNERFIGVNPVQELKGGYDGALTTAVRDFELSFMILSELTGIDRTSSMSAIMPSPDSATETKLAVASTQDTLQWLYAAWIHIFNGLNRVGSIRIQELIRLNEDVNRGYYNVISDSAIKSIKEFANNPASKYGISIHARPSRKDVEDIKNNAGIAMNKGYIDGSAYSFIMMHVERPGGAKLMYHYLKILEKKGIQQQQEAAVINTKALADKEIAVEQQKHANMMELTITKGKLDIIAKIVDSDIQKGQAEQQAILDTLMQSINQMVAPPVQQAMPEAAPM